ncbi:MAG: glycosyl transferase [Leeuwenhoekiella sp.]|nr:glycosyl transferase [Pseudomonadales bacterium]MBQ53125.1 glycosyl transferase [Leeuwenhoekiella sp.]
MRVIFFVTVLDSGGLENYLLRFLENTSQGFDKVFIWCKSGCDGQLDSDYLKLENVELVKQEIRYFDFSSYRHLGEFIKKNKVDAVCDFSGNFSGRVMYTAKKSGVPKRIASYRGSSDHFNRDPFRKIYNKFVRYLTRKYATDILANSCAGFDYFFPKIWRSDKRFRVVYNGINPEKFLAEQGDLRYELSIPDKAYVIGHTGRFNSVKNHTTIIAVAKKIVSKYSDVYFILCGNGVSVGLGQYLIDANLDHRVFVYENRSDIPKFLNTMDCYFFPSLSEGQPNSLIEAMIMGLPYVASNIAPIRETVGDDATLYQPTDIDGLTAALEQLYLNKVGRCLRQKQYMISRFSGQKRFGEFYNILKG